MIKLARSVPIEILREALDYDRGTGIVLWKIRPVSHFNDSKARTAPHTAAIFNSIHAGKVAGHTTDEGYIIISVCGVSLLAHRIAYALVTGRWPEHEIDHQNGKTSDNRWQNIRSATRSQNARNLARRKDNQSGVVGVGWHNRSHKWRARITIGRKTTILGGFPTFEEACVARSQAEKSLGFHVNHGRSAA